VQDGGQHEPAQRDIWPACIAILLFAALSTAPFVPPPWRIMPAAVAIVATVVVWRASSATAHFGFSVALLITLLAIPGVWALWPAPLLVAIVGYVAVKRVTGDADEHPLPRGRLDWRSGVVMGAFVVTSAVALVGWYLLVQPDLSDAVARIPQVPFFVLILGGIGFALINALGEEFVWRGFGTHALEQAGVHVGVASVIQAVSFGLIHIHGFPHGWIGVGLATIYGVMMGLLRWLSGGLLVPWMAHVAADLVIFAVLASLVLT